MIGSRATRAPAGLLLAAALTVALGATVAGCSASAASPAHASSAAPVSSLLAQLDALPTIDGATRTAQTATATTASQSYRVPAGTSACLQILARLDAGGYEVVAGPDAVAVDPATCQPHTQDVGINERSGHGSILAAGGSQIALSWTIDGYRVTVTGD